MADTWDNSALNWVKRIGRLAIIAGMAATLSACAQNSLGPLADLSGGGAPKANLAPKGTDLAALPQSELVKATEYWGKKFAGSPRDPKYAVNYARNLKAMGQKRRALAVLQQASIFNGKNQALASEYGRLALDLGQTGLASKILAKADNPTRPDWRIISARGTALAKQGQNAKALAFFERASILAPNQSSVLNNLAMAYTMDGRPEKAEPLLRRAVLRAKPNHAARIRQNLSLVLGLQGKYDEAKSVSAGQLGLSTASANVAAIKKLVKLKAQLSPAAKAESLVQIAKRANGKKRIASARRTRKRHKPAWRSSTITPAKTAPQLKTSTVAQNAPAMLRSKSLY